MSLLVLFRNCVPVPLIYKSFFQRHRVLFVTQGGGCFCADWGKRDKQTRFAGIFQWRAKKDVLRSFPRKSARFEAARGGRLWLARGLLRAQRNAASDGRGLNLAVSVGLDVEAV